MLLDVSFSYKHVVAIDAWSGTTMLCVVRRLKVQIGLKEWRQ